MAMPLYADLARWIAEADRLLAKGDDDQAVAGLKRLGAPPVVARRIVVLAPIAFGRQVIEPIGVRVSDDIEIRSGSRATRRPLDTFDEYRAAREIAADPELNRFQTLAVHGPEFGVVNRLLNEGSRPQDIELSPVLTVVDIA